MQLILLQDVPKVGRKFDVVMVSSGYANNFLLPRKLAEVATPKKSADLAARKAAIQAADAARSADIEERLGKLDGETVVLTAKADDNGHLYKKVHADDIVAAILSTHSLLLSEETVLLDAPLHEVGDHPVSVEAAGKRVTVTVRVTAE